MPTFTPEAKQLLRKLEGLRLSAYQDDAGVWTAGFGHTGTDVGPGTTWSIQEAEAALDRDLAKFVPGVAALTAGAPALGDERFSALCIFAFNVGLAAFRGSTLLRVVMAGDYDSVPAQIRSWIHVHKGGALVVDPGLVKRRDAEVRLWNSGKAVV